MSQPSGPKRVGSERSASTVLRARAGWTMPHPPLDPAAVAAHVQSTHHDVVWLDSSLRGAHLIGTGATRVEAATVAEVDELLRTDDGPWVGWFGYESGVEAMTGEPARQPTASSPVALLRLDQWVVIEPDGTTLLCARMPDHAWTLPASLQSPTTVGDRPSVAVHPADDDASYLAKITRCIEHIEAGDAWVLCLTTALTTGPIDAFASHLRLRDTSPVPHGGFLRIGATSLSSASMEHFLSVRDGHVRTSPIKGTRRRSRDPVEDDQLRHDLVTSAKERAENVMIVDLCRNDLGRVCVAGSVQVPELLQVHTYATVHQLVSTITGRLRDGLGPTDALQAMFPAGSMTGAPKRRAMQILDELEARPRGVYSGCFGLVSGAWAELAMVIRSVVSTPDGAHLGVGGGITALSNPDDELAEVELKARALRRSLVAAPAPDDAP